MWMNLQSMSLVVVLLVLIASGTSCNGSDPGVVAAEIRGVLLISIDTTRADRLGVYGYPGDPTPHIDALAQGATVFNHVVAPAAMTQPSHASMFTGLDPTAHGVRGNTGYRLGDSNLTLAEILSAQGFVTHAIVASDVLDPKFGFDQGFDTYDAGVIDTKRDGSLVYRARPAGEVATGAAAFLDKQGEDPFFLFLHFYDAHAPHRAPEAFYALYPGDKYQAGIAYVAVAIGSVLAKLEQLGLDDSTLIILTADHGEARGAHGELTHGYFIYQDALRVPLVIRVPGLPKAPRVGQVVGLVDIFPTVLELLGIDKPNDKPSGLDGISLAPFLRGEKPDVEPRYLYAEAFEPTNYGAAPLFALVGDRWKYIHTSRPELYDLESDVTEARNRIDEEPEIAAEFVQRLRERFANRAEQTRTEDHSQLTDPETVRRLRELGYLTGAVVDENIDFDVSRADPKDFISAHAALLKAGDFTAKDQFDDADVLLDEILLNHPDLAIGHFYKGKNALRQGIWASAIVHLEIQLTLTPEPEDSVANSDGLQKPGSNSLHLWKLAEVHDLVGFAYAASKRYSKAETHFRKAIALAPGIVTHHLHLADVLYRVESEQAAEAYREVLELDPSHAKALHRLEKLEATRSVVDP
jgi:arylsulfatase A-like enzyme